MRRLIFTFFLCFSISLGAQEAERYEGKPISEVKFEGLSSVSENELRGLMRPYIGRPYSDSVSWEIQSKLYALDYFDLIIPELQSGDAPGDSVILVFQVQEKPIIDDVVFSGNSKVRRGALLDAVLVKSGDILNPGALSVDEQALVDLYLEKGFIDAEVEADYSVDEAENRADVVFRISEGGQTKISEIRFVGNDEHASDTNLRTLMKTKAQSLFNRGLFVETKLQEDLKEIERYYGDRGLVDAEIVNVDKQIVFDEDANLNTMVITISIDEGDVWSFGGLRFSGSSIYSAEELQELVSQVPGDTFSASLFQRDYQRISDLYYENGYIFNTITYKEERDEETLSLFYQVDIIERERAHIENIIIRGNSKTKSYVIRRELPLDEGEVFSKAKITEGMLNLYNLRYFDAVEPETYPGSEDGLMDLVIDVAEGKTSDVTFGLAFSGGGEFPISVQVNWNDRNFLGRGQVLGAKLSANFDKQQVSLAFTEPRLLGKRWSGGIDLSYSHTVRRRVNQDRDLNGVPDPYITWRDMKNSGDSVPLDTTMQYDSHFISTGLNTGYTWLTRLGRLGVSTRLGFSWEYVTYDASVYTPHNSLIRDNLDSWLYSDSISVRIGWDTRDILYDPTRGFLLSETFTYAGIFESVSNRNYLKSVSRFNWNLLLFDIPVGKKEGRFKAVFSIESVFNAIFDKPWLEPVGNIAETNGFIVDGMFIARGWPVVSGEYYRYLWDNTAQIKLPIVPRILSFDIFLDAVGAWQNSGGESSALDNWSGNDWRFGLGMGFRFANPQFPIGIYLVKRFQWKNDVFTWFPDDPGRTWYEFPGAALDLVIAFDLDIY